MFSTDRPFATENGRTPRGDACSGKKLFGRPGPRFYNSPHERPTDLSSQSWVQYKEVALLWPAGAIPARRDLSNRALHSGPTD